MSDTPLPPQPAEPTPLVSPAAPAAAENTSAPLTPAAELPEPALQGTEAQAAAGTSPPAAHNPEAGAASATATAADPATESQSMDGPPPESEPAQSAPVDSAPAEGTSPDAEAAQTAPDAGAAATPAKRPAIPDMGPAACAAALAERFPALFGAGAPLPIKLRVQADIQQRAPGIFSKKTLSIFLHRHTTSTAYIRALLAAPHRFDLDGQPAGEIAEEHRAAATLELERRRAIVMARRAAERDAMRAGQRAAPGQPAPADANAADAVPAAADGAPAAAEGAPRPPRPPRPERAARPQGGARPPRENRPPGAPGEARPPRPPRPAGTEGTAPSRPPRGPDRGTDRGTDRGPDRRPDHRAPHGANAPREQQRPDRPDQRRPTPQHPPADATHAKHRAPAQAEAGRGTAPMSWTPEAAAQESARRERQALLRTFEGSTLTKANFLVLKRMQESELDAQLALARQEREQYRASEPPDAREFRRDGPPLGRHDTRPHSPGHPGGPNRGRPPR